MQYRPITNVIHCFFGYLQQTVQNSIITFASDTRSWIRLSVQLHHYICIWIKFVSESGITRFWNNNNFARLSLQLHLHLNYICFWISLLKRLSLQFLHYICIWIITFASESLHLHLNHYICIRISYSLSLQFHHYICIRIITFASESRTVCPCNSIIIFASESLHLHPNHYICIWISVVLNLSHALRIYRRARILSMTAFRNRIWTLTYIK